MENKDDKPLDSGENESDHMKGVKEIKGADVAKEPEVKIDVQKHKDEEDTDSAKNEVAPTVPVDGATSAPSQSSSQPVSAENPTARSVQSTTVVQKQSHMFRNCVIIALLLGCFLCLACVGGAYFFRDRFFQVITNSTARQDSSVKTVTKDQLQNSATDFQALIDQKKSTATVNSDGSYNLTFTEDELLAAALKNVQGIDPSAIGLKFNNGSAKIQIDVGKILSAVKDNPQASQQLQNLPFDVSMLNGVIITGDVVTNADGTKLSVQNLSTGNPVLDALIPADALSSLNNGIDLNSFLSNDTSEDGTEVQNNIQIERIVFTPGLMTVTVKE